MESLLARFSSRNRDNFAPVRKESRQPLSVQVRPEPVFEGRYRAEHRGVVAAVHVVVVHRPDGVCVEQVPVAGVVDEPRHVVVNGRAGVPNPEIGELSVAVGRARAQPVNDHVSDESGDVRSEERRVGKECRL